MGGLAAAVLAFLKRSADFALDPIAPGLAIPDFMARLEAEVETHSNRLMAEAGFNPGATART